MCIRNVELAGAHQYVLCTDCVDCLFSSDVVGNVASMVTLRHSHLGEASVLK